MKSQETTNPVTPGLTVGASPEMVPHQNGKKKKGKVVLWNAISLLLFFIMFANTFFCTILLYNYSFSSQENQMLLRSLITKFQQQPIFHDDDLDRFNFAVERKPHSSSGFKAEYRRSQEFQRLIKLPSTTAAPANRECPPCPTCKPTIEVPTNKDPVSLVNSVYRERAVYSCQVVCTEPPIHVANLTIDNDLTMSWEGRGSTRQRAKHDAAYDALLQLQPDLAEVAVQTGWHDEEYNPPCNALLRHYDDKAKKC